MSKVSQMREFEISLGMLMITKQPTILSISGIGSCVALAMRDNETCASGLAHIVLPASNGAEDLPSAPARFADNAVRTLIQGLLAAGSTTQGIKAKLAGGARGLSGGGFDGYKNVESIRRELNKNGVAIVAEDVGSTYGRAVKFDTLTGNLIVRRYQKCDGTAEFKDEITI